MTDEEAYKLLIMRAVHHLEEAVNELEEAEQYAPDQGHIGFIAYHQNQIAEILSCDHDQAGLVPYLRGLK